MSEQKTTEIKQGTLNVYCCGGAGYNIGTELVSELLPAVAKDSGFASIKVMFMDTSIANMRNEIRSKGQDWFNKNCHIVDAKDGSGQQRNENSSSIARDIGSILRKFEPADMNIVLFSAGGGSGSVLGPLLMKEMVNEKALTMGIVIASSDNAKAAENTIGTMKTLTNLSNQTCRPFVISYIDNTSIGDRREANIIAYNLVMLMSLLFSANHKALDRMDLYNMFNYDKVTSHKPALVALVAEKSADDIKLFNGTMIAVASLVEDQLAASVVNTEYHVVGECCQDISKNITDTLPIHYIITQDPIAEISINLGIKVEQFKNTAAARENTNTERTAKALAVIGNTVDDTGLVF